MGKISLEGNEVFTQKESYIIRYCVEMIYVKNVSTFESKYREGTSYEELEDQISGIKVLVSILNKLDSGGVLSENEVQMVIKILENSEASLLRNYYIYKSISEELHEFKVVPERQENTIKTIRDCLVKFKY